MNKLKLIETIIDGVGILMIVGISIVIVVFVLLPEGKFIEIGEPHLEIISKELTQQITPLLQETAPNVQLGLKTVQLSVPVHLSIRILIITLALITSGYISYIVTIIKKITRDIRNNTPFNLKNIKRIKRIGLLVTIAPIMEWVLNAIFSIWIKSQFQFEGFKLVSSSNLGLPVLFLGLLIVVLGVAFEYGQKIQEENELTV